MIVKLDKNSNAANTIQVIKAFGDLFIEISEEEKIVSVWARDLHRQAEFELLYKGKYLDECQNSGLVSYCSDLIRTVCNTAEPIKIEYDFAGDDKLIEGTVRIIPSQQDTVHVYVVVENPTFADNIAVAEDKWKMALDAVGDGVWDIDMVTGQISFSAKWHEMFGYGPHEIKTAKDWTDRVHPDDLRKANENFERYLQGETAMYSSQLRYRCKDGTYKWILSRGIIVSRTADNKPLRVVGTHSDIHSMKLNEQLLLENERRYRILFEKSEALICTHDLDGNILTVNPFVYATLGYTVDELRGRPLSALMPEEHRGAFQSTYLSEIRANGRSEGVMQILDKNQQTRYLLYQNFLVDSIEIPYVIGFSQDVTARIKMEEQLKTSMDTFSSAFKYSGVGIALLDIEGRWLDVNNAICSITGYTREELLATNFQEITYAEDLEADLNLVGKMLRREIENYTLEKRYVSKGGKIIWVSLTVSLVWNSDGTPKFFISQVIDITDQKRLTAELNARNNQLEAAKENLISKIERQEQVNHIIGHNLRGPAGNIMMLSKVLLANTDASFATEDTRAMNNVITQEQATAFIYEASKALMESLESLLELSQVQLNKRVEYDDCYLPEIISKVCTQLQATIFEKGAVIDTQLETECLSYPRAYLENILYNLLSNALKYSRAGVRPEITVATRVEDAKTILIVSDNGIGIDVKKFGGQLFQLNQTFHQGYDSKGVGLYLVKSQIEALGGTIAVNSTVNKGSEFIVTLTGRYSV